MIDCTPENTEEILEYPCEIAVKAMGKASDNFEATVLTIVRKHAADLGENAVSMRFSKKSKYLSVTVRVNAKSRMQMDLIYQDLVDHDDVIIAI